MHRASRSFSHRCASLLSSIVVEPPKVTSHHPSSVDMVIIDALLKRAKGMTLVTFLNVRAEAGEDQGCLKDFLQPAYCFRFLSCSSWVS